MTVFPRSWQASHTQEMQVVNVHRKRVITVLWIKGILTYTSEKAMAPHSSTLAWKIPWTEEPGRLQSMELLRVGHDWATSLSLFTFMHWRKDMATHSSVLAWRIRRTVEPGGLTSMGSHRVGHDRSDLAAAAAGCIKFLLQISEKQLFCLCFFQYKQSMFCLFL